MIRGPHRSAVPPAERGLERAQRGEQRGDSSCVSTPATALTKSGCAIGPKGASGTGASSTPGG